MKDPAAHAAALDGARHGHRHRPVRPVQRRLPGGAAARVDPVGAVGPRGHAAAQHRVPRYRRGGHGGRDHGVDLRLRERAGAGGSARLLRDGQGWPVLPSGRRAERRASARVRAGAAGALGGRARAAAHLRRHDGPLRQPLLEPARLRHLGGADLLRAHGRRAVPPARDAPGCAAARTRRSATRSCPALYIVGALAILFVLFAYRPATTWPGLAIVLAGVPVYLLAKGSARA